MLLPSVAFPDCPPSRPAPVAPSSRRSPWWTRFFFTKLHTGFGVPAGKVWNRKVRRWTMDTKRNARLDPDLRQANSPGIVLYGEARRPRSGEAVAPGIDRELGCLLCSCEIRGLVVHHVYERSSHGAVDELPPAGDRFAGGRRRSPMAERPARTSWTGCATGTTIPPGPISTNVTTPAASLVRPVLARRRHHRRALPADLGRAHGPDARRSATTPAAGSASGSGDCSVPGPSTCCASDG